MIQDEIKQPIKYEFLYKIIIILLIINAAFWLLSPVPDDGDSYLYANIVKELANSNNWYALTYHGADWLDKPHLPFWVGAICFKIFGSSMISYNISGFLFYLLGGFYCFKLAQELYTEEVAWVSTIIYFSITRIAISAIFIRAEIFLLAELVAAAYFGWRYDNSNKTSIPDLLGLAFFTALAIMTKGIFIVISIFGSLFIVWMLKKQYLRALSWKYILVYLTTAVFILPEIIALYLQFDSHPEKTIEMVGQQYTNISGIKWFFWGSQFGRFFNNGYISHDIPVGGGYLYFIPVFIEFFLPWTLILICAIIHHRRYTKNLLKIKLNQNHIMLNDPNAGYKYVYLLSSFLILFFLFSISKFQASLYITILFSFPAIITANFLVYATEPQLVRLIKIYKWLFYAMLILIPCAVIAITTNRAICMVTILVMIGVNLIWQIIKRNDIPNLFKLLVLLVLMFLLQFNTMMTIKNTVFMQHGIGMELSETLHKDAQADPQQLLPIVYYGINDGYVANELLFNTNRTVSKIDQLYDIRSMNMLHFYLLTPDEKEVKEKLVRLFPASIMLGRYEISRFHGLHRTEHQVVTLFRI